MRLIRKTISSGLSRDILYYLLKKGKAPKEIAAMAKTTLAKIRKITEGISSFTYEQVMKMEDAAGESLTLAIMEENPPLPNAPQKVKDFYEKAKEVLRLGYELRKILRKKNKLISKTKHKQLGKQHPGFFIISINKNYSH